MSQAAKPVFFCLLIALYALMQPANAQVPISVVESLELLMENISISDGLSQGMTNDLEEDADGYLWIATKDGLNRYDGKKIKVFRHDPKDSVSISENFIYSICIDKAGRLWAGTQSGGVNLFLPESETFLRFNTNAPEPRRLTSNFIGDLSLGVDGEVILESLDQYGYNVIRVNDESGQLSFETSKIKDHYPGIVATASKQIWTKYLQSDAKGNFWYCDGDSLFRFDREAQLGLKQPQSFPYDIRERMGDANGEIMLFDSARKNLIISDGKQKLKSYNPNTKSFEELLTLPPQFEASKQQFLDKDSRLWLWQPDKTVLRVDVGKMTGIHIKPLWRSLPQGTLNHRGISLQDSYGNYWLGTGGNGLLKIGAYNALFTRVSETTLTRDNDIRLHRIAAKGCKNLFDPDIYNLWLECSAKLNLEAAGLKMSDLNANLVFDENNFWYSASRQDGSGSAILKINSRTAEFEIIVEKGNLESSWFGCPFFLDRSAEIWFGEKLSGNQIRIYHVLPDGGIKAFEFPVFANKHQYRFISDVVIDSKDVFWFGTTQGLFSFDTKTEKWKRFNLNGFESSTTDPLVIFSLCEDPTDPSKILWIGTDGQGLIKYDKSKEEVVAFYGDETLPNKVVYGIQSDENKRLWISTNFGITWLDPVSGNAQVFTENHGLAGNEFNRYEYSKTENGELYFGGTNGVVHFQPAAFYLRGKEPEIKINQLSILNVEQVFNSSSTRILDSPIERSASIELPYDFNMINLKFTTMDLTAPSQDRFQYKINELNQDWIDAGSDNSATYTNLDPGNYTFMVRGKNSTNTWNSVPKTLEIIVKSPWWNTIWFKALLVFMILLLPFLAYRYRLNQLLELERLRNRIAQDLHDDIGSTLSSISIYSSVLLRNKEQVPSSSVKVLNKISESTTEMMERMNDIVWSIKAENDAFDHVVNRMRTFAVKLTEHKGIALYFNIQDHILENKLEMNRRKNLYLIFKEAIHNAVKYSQCQSISVHLAEEKGLVLLQIIDNGVGFDPENSDNESAILGGNGIKGMKARAQELGGELDVISLPGPGTSINLTFRL